MSQTIDYNAGSTISTVPPETIRVVEVAHGGESGTGSATIYDDGGTITIVGLKPWTITQSTAASGNLRVFTGFTWDRHYRRGPNVVGAGREIDVTLVDVNTLLGFHVISGADGKRAAETVSGRLAWLLGSDYVDFVDAGLVVYPDTPMDANDYRSQVAGDVLADCANATGFNYFLYYDEATDSVGLFFDDANRSTAFTTTTKISNVAGDANGTTVLAPSQDAELTRDPTKVASGVYVPYARGATYRTNAATATAFHARDMVAPTSTVKTLTSAQTLGDRLLGDNDEEDDTITCSVWVLPANVNDIRAGHRMQVKFSHLPGYTSYTYVRVLRRTISQPDNTDARYQLDLELSPMAPVVACDSVGNVDLNLAHGTVTGYTSGPTLGGSVDNIVAPANPSNMNDGNDATQSSSTNTLLGITSNGPYYNGWISDLGATYTVACMDFADPPNGLGWGIPDTVEYSADGVTWTSVAYTLILHSPTIPFRRFVFSASHAARYWRLTVSITNPHNLPYGYGYFQGVYGSTWRITGQ